jgi:hypothetical protein
VDDSSARPSPAAANLPESYGEPRVTLLPVNPYLVHAYWDFDAHALPQPIPPATLRFHDVTEGSAGSTFDVAVDLAARGWYVPLWSPARSYYVELGWNEEGGFHLLARSNTVETPRAWPVTDVDASLPPVASETLRQRLEEVYVTRGVLDSAAPSSGADPQVCAGPPGPALAPVSEPTGAPAADTPEPSPEQQIPPPPAAAEPSARPPVDAAEALRHRLQEIYSLLGVQPPPAPEPASNASPEPVPSAAEPPIAPADLTAQVEERFSSGVSSDFRIAPPSAEPKV